MPPELLVVLKAAVVAVAVSLPPGPAAALCGAYLRRGGFAAGAAASLGAAAADVLYGLLAAKGIAPLAMLAPPVRRALLILLAGVLGVAGALSLRGARRPRVAPPPAWPLGQGFVLALAAPGVLPAFVVLHAALGLGPDAPFPAVAFGTVLGCAAGWYGILVALRRYAAEAPRIFEYVLPAALLVGGLGILGSAFR